MTTRLIQDNEALKPRVKCASSQSKYFRALPSFRKGWQQHPGRPETFNEEAYYHIAFLCSIACATGVDLVKWPSPLG
jgi:hypothetical protein